MRDKLILPVAIAIMFVWVASAMYSFATARFVPLEIATPAMLILSGFVFGIQISKKNGNQ